MSNQEIAKSMIDKLPDDKIIYIINILKNIGEMYGLNIVQTKKRLLQLRKLIKW